jgi:methionyl-tRNA formyltransferase
MDGLKIVVMIGTPPYLHHFANRIHERFPLALVIRENSRANLLKKIRQKGLHMSFRIAVNQLRNRGRFEQDYKDLLGNTWSALHPDIPLLETEQINADCVKEALQSIQPDLVLVHGTTLIADKTLETVPLALNLHWGLSPYYRGSYCTEWALLHDDAGNIGFTIHRIASRIDGGAILLQGRPSLDLNDTVHRINMKLTASGTEAMLGVIDRLQQGETPIWEPQKPGAGQLYLTKHWNPTLQAQIRALEHGPLLKQRILHPSKPAVPLVQWLPKSP